MKHLYNGCWQLYIMKIFSIIFLLLLFSYDQVKAQDAKEPDYCVMLKKVMEADFYKEHFYTCDDMYETFVMNDPFKSFDCNQFYVCKRSVTINHNIPNNLNFKDIERMGLPDNNFFIELRKVKSNKYKIYFQQAQTNASLIAEISVKNNRKIKVSLVTRGVY